MNEVRLGMIGCGSMGQMHMDYFDTVSGLKFTAACDVDADTLKTVTDKYDVRGFEDGHELIKSGEADAILIATPHYFHPVYAQAGFEAGLHVLTEKPVAVTAKAAQETNEAYEAAKKKQPDLIYAGMFNQRARPDWKQIKRMTDSGRVGDLVRVSWTITTWFRSQAYYDSGGWRATWKGEGGGVLINQCPHNLDLFQWFVGMPSRVQAMVGLGKHHEIEVEDDVLAMMNFDNGAVGSFITTTGEAPGVNRLEIVGDKGTLIADGGKLKFIENLPPASVFREDSRNRMGTPERVTHTIEVHGKDPGHRALTENFVDVILGKEDNLIAPAVEGIHGLELGNAMLLSGLKNSQPVDLPTDRDEFAAKIDELIANSTFQKKEPDKTAPVGVAPSF